MINDEDLQDLIAPINPSIIVDPELPELNSVESTDLVVPQTKTAIIVHEELPDQSYDEDVEDDFELARKTMRELLINGQKAVENVLELTKETEHPRTFEVAAGLIKTMGETAKDLMELHKSRKAITDDDSYDDSGVPAASGTTNIQQAVFVGSTADLQELIRANLQKNEKVIDGTTSIQGEK